MKRLLHVLIWFFYVFVYLVLLSIGTFLSGIIVLSTMKNAVVWLDGCGNERFDTRGKWPLWAWIWLPYGQTSTYGDQAYIADVVKGNDRTMTATFKRRLKYFYRSKETNLNTALLGKNISTKVFRVRGDPDIIQPKGKLLRYLMLTDHQGRFRLIIRIRDKWMLDLGWRLFLKLDPTKVPYRARLLCRWICLKREPRQEGGTDVRAQ